MRFLTDYEFRNHIQFLPDDAWETEADWMGRMFSHALTRYPWIEGKSGPLPRRSVSTPFIQMWLKVAAQVDNPMLDEQQEKSCSAS